MDLKKITNETKRYLEENEQEISKFLFSQFVNNYINCLQESIKIKEKNALSTLEFVENDNLEKKVAHILLQIGISRNLKGFNFLKDAIIIVSDKPEEYHQCITKILYPEIAKKYETTPIKVERAMRHAIEISWKKGNMEILNDIFGYNVNLQKKKPTNSEFIYLIAEEVKNM